MLRFTTHCLLIVSLCASFVIEAHGEWYPAAVRLETDTMVPLLDFQNRQSDKELLVLEQNRDTVDPHLIVGTQLRSSLLFAQTNGRDQFPYLGRFPTDFVGTTASDARLLQANFNAVTNVNPWITGYVDILFSDVFTFPDFKQGSFQVRQAYAVVGNKDVTPWYGFIGKKNVSFGDFSTLSPFTQAVPWHYFAALAEGAGVGYENNGLHFVASALNGSRGIRVVDSEQRGRLNNFAANLSYTWTNDNSGVRFGAGYLYGSIYDGATAEHLDATVTGPRNGIWDVHGAAKYKRLTVLGEFVQTEAAWPVTGSRVTAYKVESALDIDVYRFPGWLSGSWSEGIQGAPGSQFEFNRQLVVGLAAQVSNNVLLSMEYVESTGFAPLINITTVSDRDVRQRSVVFGLVFVL